MFLPGQQPKPNYYVLRHEQDGTRTLLMGPVYYEIGLTWLRSNPPQPGGCHELTPFKPKEAEPTCLCLFTAVGKPMNSQGCEVHSNFAYKCDCCSCEDYRPSSERRSQTHWPKCVCGHIAQDHN